MFRLLTIISLHYHVIFIYQFILILKTVILGLFNEADIVHGFEKCSKMGYLRNRVLIIYLGPLLCPLFKNGKLRLIL